MKLTGTNSSIGLIVLIACARQTKFDDAVLLSWREKKRSGRAAPQGATASGLAELRFDAQTKIERVPGFLPKAKYPRVFAEGKIP
jgi:uncharacterized protein (DUF2252 family)